MLRVRDEMHISVVDPGWTGNHVSALGASGERDLSTDISTRFRRQGHWHRWQSGSIAMRPKPLPSISTLAVTLGIETKGKINEKIDTCH